MTRFHRSRWKPVIPILIISLAASVSAAEVVIDITRFSARKIPVAVTRFAVIPETGGQPAAEAAALMTRYLNFTGYLRCIDPGLFPSDAPIPDETALTFSDWRTLGAELMVLASIRMENDMTDVELRLMDPFKEELLVGKRYKGWSKDLPRIIRKFCGEISLHLTGNPGVFDTRIAYVSTHTGAKEIHICDFDGTNIRRFTRHNSITLTPAWSSDAKWLAYTSYARGTPDLYIRHMERKQGAVVSKKGINTTPAWVPGAAMLSATLSFSGDPDIYLVNPSGHVVKRLTSQWGIDTSPSWSGDGKRFVFVSSRSGTPQLYMKSVGGRAERLTFKGRYNTQPAWSPVADKILYSRIEGGEINIYLLDLASRESIRLTYGSEKNESPSWSPDGSLIAFSSNRDGKSRIYVMTAMGTDQRRLISGKGEQFSPAWSPPIGME